MDVEIFENRMYYRVKDIFCKKCELTTESILIVFPDDRTAIKICCICLGHVTIKPFPEDNENIQN